MRIRSRPLGKTEPCNTSKKLFPKNCTCDIVQNYPQFETTKNYHTVNPPRSTFARVRQYPETTTSHRDNHYAKRSPKKFFSVIRRNFCTYEDPFPNREKRTDSSPQPFKTLHTASRSIESSVRRPNPHRPTEPKSHVRCAVSCAVCDASMAPNGYSRIPLYSSSHVYGAKNNLSGSQYSRSRE